jgi:hypothetical protein
MFVSWRRKVRTCLKNWRFNTGRLPQFVRATRAQRDRVKCRKTNLYAGALAGGSAAVQCSDKLPIQTFPDPTEGDIRER